MTRQASLPLHTPAVVAYVDGGSRGNPGPAGFGVRLEDRHGNLLSELKGAIGVATNNVAEYNGLLAALRWAVENGRPSVHVRSDSELLVKQLRGEYRVRNPGLQRLYAESLRLVGKLPKVTFEHVPRTMNVEADRLANLAMDEAAGLSA